MKQILAFFLLITTLSSCKKSSSTTNSDSGYYTINGIVLDVDSRTPVAGAKVYAGAPPILFPSDSAFSDAAGRVSFQVKKEGPVKTLYATKGNYLLPHSIFSIYISAYVDRTDTVYLARASYVNLTVHRTGTYLPLDSIALKVAGDYYSAAGYSGSYRNLLRDKADAPDKVFNLYSWYQSPNFTKVYFQWDIIRNGAVISTQSDSTTMTQYATKNYTLNY